MGIHPFIILFFTCIVSDTFATTDQEWVPFSPREEISPSFKFVKLEPGGNEHWIIQQSNQAGEIGAWSRNYSVEGGSYYRIRALCLGSGLSSPRTNRYVEVFFETDEKNGNRSKNGAL